jgi:thiamine transport system ATP-binding protein
MKLTIKAVEKRFPGFQCNINFEVASGSLVTLLGPSGSGKSTTLQLISGLIPPDRGEILLGEELLSQQDPWKRGIGFVFQDYALFPHLSVYENVAYGLRLARREAHSKIEAHRKIGSSKRKKEIEEKVMQMLELTGLMGYEKRMPSTLSGGEQQRVALARALAPGPRILLLDEPLSALDTPLRSRLRKEIREIQTRLGLTTIYVTHDREEALSMSDQVVIMKDGATIEYGTPESLYRNPKKLFTAGFLGDCSPHPRSLEEGTGKGGGYFRPEDGHLSLKPQADSVKVTLISLQFLGYQVKAEVLYRNGESKNEKSGETQGDILTVTMPGDRFEELKEYRGKELYLTVERDRLFFPESS